MGRHEIPRGGGRVLTPQTAHKVIPFSLTGLLAGRNCIWFGKLMAECDEVIEEQRRLFLKTMAIYQREPGTAVMDLADAEMSDHTRTMVKRCRERLEHLTRREYYEDVSEDDEEGEELILKLEIIAER